uniref:Uncharacterized protein n=2 Tax=Oryza sativa subsp. japonica TaxID=39947 RepID=Q69QX1_ORYSJ|nr:hypothetical protein [Oryza sativa Japonica Group]BAD31805.1 hypothetical protein [Oryza sativa Japonica Group]
MVQISLKADLTAAEAAAWLGHGTRPPHRPWHTVARAATGGTAGAGKDDGERRRRAAAEMEGLTSVRGRAIFDGGWRRVNGGQDGPDLTKPTAATKRRDGGTSGGQRRR